LGETSNHLRAGGIGEAFQFEQMLVEVVLRVRPLQRRADKESALDRR
jgi:hypothetical protein